MSDPRPAERTIFLAAIDRPPADRAAYLAAACAGDERLRAEVEELLAAHDRLGTVDAPVPTSDPPGGEGLAMAIGPYKLLEQIGEGGFGTVFLAEQTEPVRRKVALKVIKAGMDTRQVVARFEAERQALAVLDHPNIAKVFDGGQTPGGRPYFVMELVRGVPVTDYCDQNHLTPRDRLDLFVQVCQAVQHAHQKGIIHRDLKPSNVLVAAHDGKPAVKVIDFGIAKATGQQLTDKTLFTGFAQLVGTPLYMSPEQAAQSPDIDTRSDVYSLGVLLYELLTGSTPFTKERFGRAAYDEIRRIIREEDPPRPSTRLSESQDALPSISAQRHTEPGKLARLFRGEVDWIVMKALEKDRDRRYETANSFAADVQRYLNDETVQACPPSVRYRLRKFGRRNKRSLAAAVVLALALSALAASLGWMARDRSVRRTAINSQVVLALEEAGRARDLALTQTGNPYQWEATQATASAALKRGEGIAAQDESALDPAVRERVQAQRATLDADENDRLFAARFDDIRLEQADPDPGTFQFNKVAAFAGLNEAFRVHYGVDLGTTPPGQVVAVIQERPEPIRPYLVAALDTWSAQLPKENAAARAWLTAVLKEAETDPWRRRAREALAADDVPALRRVVLEATAARQSPAFLHQLARQLPLEETEMEIDLSQRVQQAYPGDFWANFHLADALSRGKPARWDRAIRYYTAAAALRPRNTLMLRLLGIALMENGEFDAAIATYRHALAIRPDAALHTALGNALHKKGDLAAAIAEHHRAIALDPRYAMPYYNLGVVLREKGSLDDAIDSYRRAIELAPDYVNAHNNLGTALNLKGDAEGAGAAFRRALEIDPEHVNALHNLGEWFGKRGELKKAEATLRRAVKLDPGHVGATIDLGVALELQKKLDEAIGSYRKAIELDPKHPLAHRNLGDALRAPKKLDEAILHYQMAAELNLKDPDAHNSLAWELATCAESKLQDPTRAVASAKRAVALAPDTGNYWNTLGLAHYRAGDWKEALAALQRGMELGKGGDSVDWFFLAMTHWKLGNKDEARKWHDRAVTWMAKNAPEDEEMRRFRAEAEKLMTSEGAPEVGPFPREKP